MPLELGMFLGASMLGDGTQRQKVAKILDRSLYRYQGFCSDIAGQDISVHGNSVETLVTVIRNWLRTQDADRIIPSGNRIFHRFEVFRQEIPIYCSAVHLRPSDLNYLDFRYLVNDWLKHNE